MKLNLKTVLVLFSLAIYSSSCKKDSDSQPLPTTTPKLTFQLKYEVDGQAVLKDSILYLTEAGFPYSIVTLDYFLSNIYLVKTDSTVKFIKDYQYASLNNPGTNNFSINNIPKGSYKGIRFNIGIDSLHNIPFGLPATTNNNNMIWPTTMGGGYHFMKFEGRFMDSTGTYGYAMHLGMNENLVTVNLDSNFTIGDNDITLIITMNLNEWFRHPNTYNFNSDGNYSMSNPASMAKLAENGKDVFHF